MVNATNANIVTHNATDDQRATKECQKHPRPLLLVVNYIKYYLIVFYNDMTSRINKELWSQNIKRILDQIGLEYLWTKAHENDIGILNIIKQRLKDIELQRWLSDLNNDVGKDANQKNKLRTSENLKQWKIINVKIISVRSPTSDTR